MIPVYQTIICKDKGNCMTAALASLLEVPLEEVPYFKESQHWFQDFHKFISDKGYEFHGTLYNPKDLGHWGDDRFKDLKTICPGVKGYYFAGVYSPAYFTVEDYLASDKHPVTHAVIIDADFNIVHDPNPNYKGMTRPYPLANKIGYNGVTDVYMIEPK